MSKFSRRHTLKEIEELIEEAINNREDCTKYKEWLMNLDKVLISEYKENAPRVLNDMREYTIYFEEQIYSKWKLAFDHLEMMCTIAQGLGEMHAKEFENENAEEIKMTMDALARIFPMAIQVTKEILYLLKGGFLDGALARWRSLYEFCVTGMYIAKHGDKTAELYLLSFHFSAKRAADEINRLADRSNLQRFTEKEMQGLEDRWASAEKKIGREILSSSCEWPKITENHKTFSDIEKDVKMDHWRPRYKLASIRIHANYKPFGTFLSVSDYKNLDKFIGLSSGGYAELFSMTSISLYQLTTIYLSQTPNIDRSIHTDVIRKLNDEMQEIVVPDTPVSS